MNKIEEATSKEVFKHDIANLEGLLLHEIIPPVYYFMLCNDIPYETGSDYSDNYLQRSLEELTNACPL